MRICLQRGVHLVNRPSCSSYMYREVIPGKCVGPHARTFATLLRSRRIGRHCDLLRAENGYQCLLLRASRMRSPLLLFHLLTAVSAVNYDDLRPLIARSASRAACCSRSTLDARSAGSTTSSTRRLRPQWRIICVLCVGFSAVLLLRMSLCVVCVFWGGYVILTVCRCVNMECVTLRVIGEPRTLTM
jgi:hypothetical protein